MPIKFHPYRNTLPQPEDSFWLYLMGGDGSKGREFVAQDFEQAPNLTNLFSLALDKLNAYWSAGQPLENQLDKKTCHDVCKFFFEGQSTKVFSFSYRNIRFYFIYLSEFLGMLLVIKVKTKSGQKLTSHEKRELIERAKQALSVNQMEKHHGKNQTKISYSD